jgi:ribosomal protein S18 acetylase RimI-like enzyme
MLLQSEGLAKALRYIIHLIRHHLWDLLIVKSEGYIIEADLKEFKYSDRYLDLKEFKYSDRYLKDLSDQDIQFHILRNGETLPKFCYEITQSETEKRLANGHSCYVLKYQDNIFCSIWVGFGQIDYSGNSVFLYSDRTTFWLNPNQAWLYDVICHPDFRKRGLATALKHEIILRLKHSGIEYVTATVGLNNIGSIKVFMRNGFKLQEKVFYKRILLFKKRSRTELSMEFNTAFIQKYKI